MSTERIQSLRKNIVGVVPSVSIERTRFYTSSMIETEEEPIIIRQAKALANVLNNMKIQILEDELIVGTAVETIPGAIVYPEAHGTRVIPELEDLVEREKHLFKISDDDIDYFKDVVNPYWYERSLMAYADETTPQEVMDTLYTGASFILTEMAGYGHVSINYPSLLSTGFQALLERAQERINQTDSTDENQIDFYKASSIVSNAIIAYAQRYADLANELASEESIAERRKELETIAKACQHVPAKPPRSFHEALQFMRFTHLVLGLETYDGQAISMGRMDQYLYPFYKRDVDKGVLTPESAKELIGSLWIKINEQIPLFDSLVSMYFEGLLTTQAVTVGGVDIDGEDVTNELTHLILDATKVTALPLPNVHIRVNKKTPPELMHTVTEVIASGRNNVAVFNDDIIIPSLTRKEVSLEDARNYSTVGCVELAPFGNSFTSSDAALFNLPICLELALTNGHSIALGEKLGLETGNPEEFTSIEDIIEAFKKQVSHFVNQMVIGSNCLEKANLDLKPTPFLSLCVDNCFEKGRDITTGSAKYNFTGVQGVGLADVADSLAALDQFVFKEERITISELIDALKKNFDGNAELRELLVNKGSKYGNDNELADGYARLVADIFSEEVEQHKNIRDGLFIAGMYSVSTHIGFGYVTGALPSGRLEGTALSNGASPAVGSNRQGLTATINSVSKLDFNRYPNGIAFTLNIDPNLLSGPEGINLLTALIQSYSEQGGMQVQFNVTKTEDLIAA
ncbi:MAG: formate C-acetyltransferase/glycerol dehydratase family glycyl radical enzyme, partial [Candidatus Thorarchaeota archaeon]